MNMKPCPHDLAAWQCTYYVHCAGHRLCQDKRRAKLDEEQDLEYTSLEYITCEGFEVDKRFKSVADQVRRNSK